MRLRCQSNDMAIDARQFDMRWPVGSLELAGQLVDHRSVIICGEPIDATRLRSHAMSTYSSNMLTLSDISMDLGRIYTPIQLASSIYVLPNVIRLPLGEKKSI